MSNLQNDILMERVHDLLEYWAGTMHQRILDRDLNANDMEALQYHSDQAWKEMMLQEGEYVL